MKKLFCLLLITILLEFPITAFASDTNSNIDLEYLDDSSYLITPLKDVAPSSGIMSLSTTVTKSKTVKYYSKNNTVKWYVKVTGTFTYDNGFARCIKSSVFVASEADTWKITSKSSNKSGNLANATVTAKQYLRNKEIKTITKTVKLTCSPTGEFL